MPDMNILCLGLSHRTAPLGLREQVSYHADAQKAALARLGCGHANRPAELIELGILSTCNRLELYAFTHTPHFEPLLQFLNDTTSVSLSNLNPYLYRYTQAEAVLHLGRVASGLDSMIIGEPQILGQVTEAYELGLSQRSIGPVLSALFRYAIHTGKRARTETAISRNPSSISSIAVKLAAESVADLSTTHTVVVGAGEMAELAVEALRARGTQHLTVINRTHARAQQLAKRWQATALTFENLSDALRSADIVITSTGAPHILIKPPLMADVMQHRPDRPLVLIDIAVPRDVDPDVNQLPNVRYYDIDDLVTRLNGSLAGRQQEIPQVEAIIAAEAEAFMAWLRSLEIMPVISDLRAKADSIRRAEVDKALRQLKGLSETERQRIEAMSEALVNKLLHDPTLRLKAEANNGHAAEYAAAVRHLFALNTTPHTLSD